MAYVAVWRAVEMRPGSTAVSGPQQRGGRGLVVVVGPAGGGAVVELVPDRGVGAAVQQHPQRLQSAVVRSQVQRGDAPPVLRAAEGAALVRVGAQLEQPPRRRRGGAGERGPGQRGAAWTSAARLAPRQMTGGWAHEGRGTVDIFAEGVREAGSVRLQSKVAGRTGVRGRGVDRAAGWVERPRRPGGVVPAYPFG